MTQRTLPSPIAWPEAQVWAGAGTPVFVLTLVDDVNEAAAFILRVYKAGNIRKIGFRLGTVNIGATIAIRVETVSNTGNPTNTLWGTNTSATLIVTAADTDTWKWVTLTADAVVVVGDILAVKFNFSVGTDFEITTSIGNFGRPTGIPYSLFLSTAGVWTRTSSVINIGLEYSDATRPFFNSAPTLTVGSTRTFNSGSSPDEIGIRLKVPMGCKATGAIVRVGEGASTTYDVILYNSASSALATVTIDADISSAPAATGPIYVPFGAPVTIGGNSLYRLVVRPTTTDDVLLEEYSVDSAGTFEQHAGGVEVYSTERTDAGAWTDTTTSRCMIALLISDLDDGIPSGTLFLGGRRRYSQRSDPLFTS